MRTIWKYWNKFWFSRFDPLAVSIYRISLGLLFLAMFIANYFNWERFYGADGIISLHDFVANRPPDDWCSVFHWTEGNVPVKVFWLLGFIASITFTVGFQTRISTIILYVLQVSMIHRNLLIVNGDDLVFRMILFYSCFAKLNYCLSVDSWIRKKFLKLKEEELPRIWPIRLIQLNVLFIYINRLPHKLVDDVAWINGEAIYYTMASNMWGRCPFPDLFYKWDCLLSKIPTFATVLIEGAFPILVWFKKTKLIVISLITLLHLGIAVAVPNVLFFTLAMVCVFWVYVPGETVRNLHRMYKTGSLLEQLTIYKKFKAIMDKKNFNPGKKISELFGVDFRSLAAFRILISIVVIFDLIFRLPDLKAFYTDEGVLPRNLHVELYDSWYACIYLINGHPGFVYFLFGLSIIFAIFLLVGYRTKFSTFALWFLLISLHSRNPLVLTGGDTLLHLLLFWSLFLPLGGHYSFDSLTKNNYQNGSPKYFLSVGSLAFFVQVAFVYWFTAIYKISSDWLEGNAIYYALNIEQYVTPIGQKLLDFPWLLKPLTFGVFWFEFLGPFLLFCPIFTGPIRTLVVFAFFCLQLGFGSCLNVGIFPFATSVAMLLFLPSWFWENCLPNIKFKVESLSKIINFLPSSLSNKQLNFPWFNNLLASFFLIIVLMWNVQSTGLIKSEMPNWIKRVSYILGLEQGWIMFGSNTIREDFWYIFPGTLKNNVVVDLFRDGKPVRWRKPKELLSTLYKNHRWRTYIRNLWVSDSKLQYSYGRYLCNVWNKKHFEDEKLNEIRFYYIREDVLLDGKTSAPIKGLAYHHKCE